MAIGNRQIGWSQESNLLWSISSQIQRLISVVSKSLAPKYKVYTALLTQSGGDDPQYQQLGSLVVGRTYEIADNGVIDWDFTNVGAPNNEIGTLFVATGTTPANWGQNGNLNFNTGAPVVTVLENTIGNIWFNYDAPGTYNIFSDDLFIDTKTTVNMRAIAVLHLGQSKPESSSL